MSDEWMVLAELPFVYREFHDVPRLLVISIQSRRLVLECRFDEGADDYPAFYEAYQMRDGFAPPGESWESMVKEAVAHLGRIEVADVHFDETRRKFVKAVSVAGLVRRMR